MASSLAFLVSMTPLGIKWPGPLCGKGGFVLVKKQQMASIAATGVRARFFLAGLGLGAGLGWRLPGGGRGGPAAAASPRALLHTARGLDFNGVTCCSTLPAG